MNTTLSVAGTVRVPGDKSISHRALLLGALSSGPTHIRSILQSADVEATARVLRAMGVSVPPLGPSFVLVGQGPTALRTPQSDLDCANSGTTTRLTAGVVAGRPGLSARFVGDASLSRRPMRRVAVPLREMGASVSAERPDGSDGLPMRVTGAALHTIAWHSEHASAQIKGALLFAAVSAGCGVTVHEPGRSRDHSERMLRARGARLTDLNDGITLAEGAALQAVDVDVPADPSSAAFFIALAALADHGELALPDVCLNPTRTGVLDVLRRMGADIAVEDEREVGGELLGTLRVRASGSASLRATGITAEEVPRTIDELPLVACVASRADGETIITGAAELRVKESDRISAVVNNLRAVGVAVEELPDGMVVRGGRHPLRGHVITHGDHRLAMAFGVLAALPGNAITIDDPGCVAVSFPTFWGELARVVRGTEAASDPSPAPAVPAPEPAETGAPSATSALHTARAERDPAAAENLTDAALPRLVIAIDGPAASGKSSTAQWVAREIGVRHVDSGAFYRAATALALESAGPPLTWTAESVLAATPRITLGLTELSVVPLIDGENVDLALRSPRVTAEVSRVASMPDVRAWVNAQVREAGGRSDVVVDGRDIGTAVFPGAALKIYLVADQWERARRRLVQRLARRPTDTEIAEETEALVARDAADATQSVPAREAITIDTTTLTQAEQVERIVALARVTRERLGSAVAHDLHSGPPSA